MPEEKLLEASAHYLLADAAIRHFTADEHLGGRCIEKLIHNRTKRPGEKLKLKYDQVKKIKSPAKLLSSE